MDEKLSRDLSPKPVPEPGKPDKHLLFLSLIPSSRKVGAARVPLPKKSRARLMRTEIRISPGAEFTKPHQRISL